jgi:hypothetical protein
MSGVAGVAEPTVMYHTTFETNRVKITVPGMGDWSVDLGKEFNILRIRIRIRILFFLLHYTYSAIYNGDD